MWKSMQHASCVLRAYAKGISNSPAAVWPAVWLLNICIVLCCCVCKTTLSAAAVAPRLAGMNYWTVGQVMCTGIAKLHFNVRISLP
jgi:hypothetical protein